MVMASRLHKNNWVVIDSFDVFDQSIELRF